MAKATTTATAMRTSNATGPRSKGKTTNFARAARFSLQPVWTRRLISVCEVVWRTWTQGQIQFILWVRTCNWVRSPRLRREVHLSLPYKDNWNKRQKVKKGPFILIARDVFLALAVVVAKAPYIHECDGSILLLVQTRKSIRNQIRWTNCLHYKTLQIYKASDSL